MMTEVISRIRSLGERQRLDGASISIAGACRAAARRHPIFSLLQDHGVAFDLARALESYADGLRGGEPAARRDLRDFATAFRVLVDWRLHEKREHVLFPWLVRHGFSWTSRAFEACHESHRLAQHLIEVLEAAAERELEWSQNEAASVRAAGMRLAQLELEWISQLETGWLSELGLRFEADVLRSLEDDLLRFDAWHGRQPHTPHAVELSRQLIARYVSVNSRGQRAAGAWKGLQRCAANAAERSGAAPGLAHPLTV